MSLRRVLMVSPHFPPDSSAGAHRVRLLAPHLPPYGWEATVVAVDPRDYEGRPDPELARIVPSTLRVVRHRAWSPTWTRRLGFGDLGLRALWGCWVACSELLRSEPFDALFITIYPTYPALLGGLLKRRFAVPFVLDYQDPWVGEWGRTVGGGGNGRPDVRSRVSRALATRLEPIAVRSADAITAVSAGTYEGMLARHPALSRKPCAPLPLGGEPADFNELRGRAIPNPYFDPADGLVHLSYVGTLLPLGLETLRAFLRAAARLRRDHPGLYARLRLHFFGTSNQTNPQAPERVLPVAREIGVEEIVTEVVPRIGYLEALRILTQSSGIVLLGSSERHYTASKLYPALLARRPILAAYHAASSAAHALERMAKPPTVRRVTYDDEHRAESKIASLSEGLAALADAPTYHPEDIDEDVLSDFSARTIAGRLASVLSERTGDHASAA